jgi:hypothetical protein
MVTAAVVGTAMAGQSAPTARTTAGGQIISCPDIRSALPPLSPEAQTKAEIELQEVEVAGQRAESQAQLAVQGGKGSDFVKENIVKPLEDHRRAAINDIAGLIGDAAKSAGLENLAPCSLASLPAQPTPTDQAEPANPPGEGF